MPVSKRRKKNGRDVRTLLREARRERIEREIDAQTAGVSLQDLINVVAYQEHTGAHRIANDPNYNIIDKENE